MIRRRALVAGLIALGMAQASRAATLRVLQPSAGDAIQAAFRAAGPEWRLQSARLLERKVEAEACRREACFNLVLSDPDEWSCVFHSEAGPWCLRWTGPRPSPADAEPLLNALRTTPPSVWHVAISPDSQWRIGGLALSLVLLPMLVGFVLGRLLRERGRARWLMVPLPAVLCLAPLAWTLRYGMWDLLSIGCLASGGVVLGLSRSLRLAPLVFSFLVLLLGALVLEVAARRVPDDAAPMMPRFPKLTDARVAYRPKLPAFCDSLEVDERHTGVERWRYEDDSDASKPLVVHIGDSMIFGHGVAPEETMVAELNRIDPGTAYANLGVPAISTDAELHILLTRLDRMRKPARVILHFYLGNDLEGIDQHYPCCDEGPVLDYGAEGQVSLRCLHLPTRFDLPSTLAQAPPPFPLRFVGQYSAAATLAMHGVAVASFSLAERTRHSEEALPETRWAHLEPILRTFRDELSRRGIPLTLVVLPDKEMITRKQETGAEHEPTRQRLLALTTKLGIATVDPLSALRELVQKEGAAPFFLPQSYEIHFSPEGHRRYARWLLTTLGPGLAATPRLP